MGEPLFKVCKQQFIVLWKKDWRSIQGVISVTALCQQLVLMVEMTVMQKSCGN